MKKIMNSWILIVFLVLCSSMQCLAAPEVDVNGNVIDKDLPENFIAGYTYGNFSKFNSTAESNGLGNTPIWIEGLINNVTSIKSGNDYITIAAAVDINGNKWLLCLDSVRFTPETAYSAIYNHKVCFAGVYTGYSGVYNMPVINVIKLYDFNNGINWKSTFFNSQYSTQNAASTISTRQTSPLMTKVKIAEAVSGRYYFTTDLENKYLSTYVNIVALADGRIKCTMSNNSYPLYCSLMGVDTDGYIYMDSTYSFGVGFSKENPFMVITMADGTSVIFIK